jgi:ribosomal-protein-alanine N-acetyltransferase
MIETKRTTIEVFSEKHAPVVLNYYLDNREHLFPWEPIRTDRHLTLKNWTGFGKLSEQAFKMGREYRFVAFTKDKSQVIGICNFTGVVRMAFQACYLGYSVGKAFEGKGYMTEMLNACISYLFEEVGLHRIMANFMPSNKASEAVLHKLGFQREGYAKEYLNIAGNWEDHILTSKINTHGT